MAVFNSLGSNYNWSDVWRSLTVRAKASANDRLKELLSKKYGGSVELTYKGREALELALLKSGLPKGSQVGINGFTCYVVYSAIKNAGYLPVFIDIADNELNFGVAELQTVHQQNPNLKAVIIQNTLGYPVNLAALVSYCSQQNIMIIEDLAHSIGTIYENGQLAGAVGDLTMLSFSQDKTIDVVAGGAMIDRRHTNHPDELKLTKINRTQIIKNRWYPFWTALIRMTYPIGLGRILHYCLKSLNLLATPMSDDLSGLHLMPSSAAELLIQRLSNENSEIEHRRQIAAIYQQEIPSSLQLIKHHFGQPSFLRFPITVQDRANLVAFMKTSQIYIGDTWYDAPIGPKKYLEQTDYKSGLCPRSEQLSQTIVNLPTHRHVSPEVAKDICAKIKLWQTSQQKP
ncbi:MAG TPA: DegT/DnrJ/EryC1/StrS family aminotransferase [Candidatus Saccharimonadales bacterium]|nr:DegT/DnrJ/EryC1/StrS family aminotransferase [Candidatus Saccharimonadales bacterium]